MKNLVLILVALLVISGCGTSGKGIEMPNYVRMEGNSKTIPTDDVDELRDLFLELEPTTYEFYEKPELILYGFRSENDKSPDMYCAFIEEGYVYVGDYFVAWADRVKGRTTKCYKLDEYTSYLLENL